MNSLQWHQINYTTLKTFSQMFFICCTIDITTFFYKCQTIFHFNFIFFSSYYKYVEILSGKSVISPAGSYFKYSLIS